MGFCSPLQYTPSPCLVKIVEKFLRIANHSKGSPLFRRMLHTKRGVGLLSNSGTKGSWADQNGLTKKVGSPQSLESIAYICGSNSRTDRPFQGRNGGQGEKAPNKIRKRVFELTSTC